MVVLFSPSARREFLEAVRSLKRDEFYKALQILSHVKSQMLQLRMYPQSGRRIPEFPIQPYREWTMGPYRIFYRTQNQIIWIAAVWPVRLHHSGHRRSACPAAAD